MPSSAFLVVRSAVRSSWDSFSLAPVRLICRPSIFAEPSFAFGFGDGVGGAVSRVFLSHSSRDNRQAIAVVRWLETAEPSLRDELFLDLDENTGIHTGQRWTDACGGRTRAAKR